MAEMLMNRCRGLAEGVVVMICPVLLALALNKVDLNGEVYGHGVPIAMLTIAGVTLITGIFPMLVCCFPQIFLGANDVNPAPVTAILATLCSSCLLVLACLIAQRIVSKPIAITFVVLCGIFVLIRSVSYYRTPGAGRYREPLMHNILDESHEFLTGVTGILFLGFEGLALEGHGQMAEKVPVGTISFIICAVGVCLMFLEITPPYFNTIEQIAGLTLALDSIMAAGIFALLMVVMFKFMQVKALLLFVPPVLIAGQLVFLVFLHGNPGGNQQAPPESTPASLELTKVTFTGFLTVSVTAISNALPSKLTAYFLLFAAAAIVFGLSWRLLSQMHMRKLLAHCASDADVASSSKLASFCTHFCIVIATVLFVVMAGKASGK